MEDTPSYEASAPIDHSMKSNTQGSKILYQHEYENVKLRKCSITQEEQIKRDTVRYSRRRKFKSVTETLKYILHKSR